MVTTIDLVPVVSSLSPCDGKCLIFLCCSSADKGFIPLTSLIFCFEYCPIRRTRRASKGPFYNLPSCRTETFANSYFNRIVPLWNNLSIELRQCSSLSIFKRLLKSHYLSLFNDQAPVVQTMDSAVYRINHYPADKH